MDGLKILIVDDDPDTREILSEILAGNGAEVAVASSARDAMAEIAQSAPDVLVSDIAMPGEDGLSLVRQLSQHAAARDRRIITIAVTGLSAPQHQRLALEAGFEACLNKPLEPARLINYIVNAPFGQTQLAPAVAPYPIFCMGEGKGGVPQDSSRIVTNSSAAVGWIPIVASN